MAEARGGKSMMLRFLEHQFGEVSPTLIEQMDNLSTAQLKSLGELLFDFETIDDVVMWFVNHAA